MHVTRTRSDRRHRHKYPPLAAVLMLALAGVAGMANAAEFDANLKEPWMKSAAALKPEAKSFAAKYREVQAATPAMLINNVSLARQQFDMTWQLKRAVDEGRPLDEFADLGLVSRGDGSYSIDTAAHREWGDLAGEFVGLTTADSLDRTCQMLVEGGFRPEDVATLKAYVGSHDAEKAARMAALPVGLGFVRVVRKFDLAKRPVPDTLVTSYFYQRARAANDSKRLWVAELFRQFDAQRVRILLSTILELETKSYWIPEKANIAVAATLMSARLPNIEELAKAEAEGVAP